LLVAKHVVVAHPFQVPVVVARRTPAAVEEVLVFAEGAAFVLGRAPSVDNLHRVIVDTRPGEVPLLASSLPTQVFLCACLILASLRSCRAFHVALVV